MSRGLCRKSSTHPVDKIFLNNEGFYPGSLFLVNADLQILESNDPNMGFRFFVPLKKGTMFMVCDTCVFRTNYMKAEETDTINKVYENNKQEIDLSWDPVHPVVYPPIVYFAYITPVSVFVKILIEENFYFIELRDVATHLSERRFTRIRPPYTNT